MQVVSQDEARQLAASGAFLYSRTAMGHTYGVQRQAVKKVQATGRVCVVELDHVEDAKKLRDSGFEAVSGAISALDLEIDGSLVEKCSLPCAVSLAKRAALAASKQDQRIPVSCCPASLMHIPTSSCMWLYLTHLYCLPCHRRTCT
jgi:hypothetical protein